jgi:Spy/CpxP family protein refolding chaperone
MVLSRTLGFLLMAASTAATAQQVPAAPQTPAPAAKPDKRLQVSCRIDRTGNMLKRVCMTNEQWAETESGVRDTMDAMRLRDRLRCSSGAC